MKIMRILFLLLILLTSFSGFCQEISGQSIYPLKINDPKAVYFTNQNFNVSADGVGDDAPALQAAIDLVLKQSQNGIVFIPEGT